ncbi:MAG: carboxypeptidase regulatory-like domain-containing protein [Deltaproteobacteria bacterium]|nr:carboxypeptidase regulatory-like domain-containing protein [Deltaproteobacteria bacterium]
MKLSRRIPRDELFLMCSFCVQLALLIFVLSLVGCGGGSEGTGASLQGRVSLSQDEPIQGAVVTVAETGQTAITDSQGIFSVNAPAEGATVTLAVTAKNVEGDVVVVNSSSVPSSSLNVNIKVDPNTNSLESDQVLASAFIVGLCDFAFENKKIIRQTAHLDDGTSCVVKVILERNGRRLGGQNTVIQFRRCDGSTDWQTQSTATTDKNVHRGIAQLAFQFFNSPEYCEYRVVAPFEDPRFIPAIFPIYTFQKQAYGTGN